VLCRAQDHPRLACVPGLGSAQLPFAPRTTIARSSSRKPHWMSRARRRCGARQRTPSRRRRSRALERRGSGRARPRSAGARSRSSSLWRRLLDGRRKQRSSASQVGVA
jgi:hypothetical protein